MLMAPFSLLVQHKIVVCLTVWWVWWRQGNPCIWMDPKHYRLFLQVMLTVLSSRCWGSGPSYVRYSIPFHLLELLDCASSMTVKSWSGEFLANTCNLKSLTLLPCNTSHLGYITGSNSFHHCGLAEYQEHFCDQEYMIKTKSIKTA